MFLALFARSALADPHTEALAKEALTKAQTEYASANYAGAANHLRAALHACAPPHCSPAVRATLLRDIGVMEFRSGDKDAAGKSFADAISLQPSIALDPAYDASDVGAAFEDQRAIAGLPAGPVSTKPPPGAKAAPAPAAAGGAAPPSAPLGEQPTGGDFAHEPALEQKENTPLPIYAEYSGSSALAHVVVKYKGAQMREWLRADMHKEGNGWAVLLPCADVTRGVMHYWIQGFDRTGEPIAASGDPKHPFYVPIRDKLTGEAPHLPGKDPPRSCEETDCPPGIAGCKAKGEGPEAGAAGTGAGGGAAGGAEGEGAGAAAATRAGLPEGAYPRFWAGASFAMDLLVLPSASNVCKLTPGATPVNPQGYYCFGFDPADGPNSNFPSRTSENMQILDGGTVPGGLTVGDLRLTLALDYAIAPNVLAGLRLGYAFNSYPGRAAAFPPRIHVEARGTYVFGQNPLAHSGLSPMAFGGLGAAEFDGRTTTHDLVVSTNAGQQTEDAWLSNGPFFVVVGGGVRYQVSPRVVFTGALRLNLSFGPLGLLPTFGPEVGAMYGF